MNLAESMSEITVNKKAVMDNGDEIYWVNGRFVVDKKIDDGPLKEVDYSLGSVVEFNNSIGSRMLEEVKEVVFR